MRCSVVAISCLTFCLSIIVWIIFQKFRFINNVSYQRHQAFRIRGKRMFDVTAVVMILNLILRPMLMSSCILELIELTDIWRDVLDISQMALYCIVSYRCFTLHYDLTLSTDIIRNLRHYFGSFPTSEKQVACFLGCCLRNSAIFGNKKIVAGVLIMHAILCVALCHTMEHLFALYPGRLYFHCVFANCLLFLISGFRFYSQCKVQHKYDHDMLNVNLELNLITLIMCVTAICDSAFSISLDSVHYKLIYVVYQTVLISLLCFIMFYLPKRTIDRFVAIISRKQQRSAENMVDKLSQAFGDAELFNNLTRFMVRELCVENVVFLTQYIQIEQLIRKSGVAINFQQNYVPKIERDFLCPYESDILENGGNLLEAARGMYDKFIISGDILQVNISWTSRCAIDEFFIKHSDIRRIFVGAGGPQTSDAVFNTEVERKTVVSVDFQQQDFPLKQKCEMLIQQLQSASEDELGTIQEFFDVFASAVQECWDNTINSFERFELTENYKFLRIRSMSAISVRANSSTTVILNQQVH